MKIEKAYTKITLSAEDVEILKKARNILDDITDELQSDESCTVVTEDGIEWDNDNLSDAFEALDNIFMPY